jgi:hypothetical protein
VRGSGGVDGDPAGRVEAAAAEIRRVGEPPAVGRQLRRERVRLPARRARPGVAGELRLQRVGRGEVRRIGLARDVGAAGGVEPDRGRGVVALPTQVGRVEQAVARAVELRDERVPEQRVAPDLVAGVPGLERASRRREVARRRHPGDVDVAGGVDGDALRVVGDAASDVGRIDGRPVAVQLGDEGVAVAAEAPGGPFRAREVRRRRLARQVRVAVRVDRDRRDRVACAGAAHVARVGE